jgi:hypothetical protein
LCRYQLEMHEPHTRVTALQRPTPNGWLRDPVVILIVACMALLAAWASMPSAFAVSTSSDARLLLGADTVVAVAPAVTKGTRAVQLADLTIPGEQRDADSEGWRVTTNFPTGYDIKLRATSDPALRGINAVDGAGADDDFQDFSTAGCPCPWTTDGFSKGVFGYSASVNTSSGNAALDTSKWGASGAKKWRGFDDTAYSIFRTPGGAGSYQMTLHLRTALPPESNQAAGSYRTTLVLMVEPLV